MLALKSLVKPTADWQKKNSVDTKIKLGKTEILRSLGRLALLSIKLEDTFKGFCCSCIL